MQQIAIRYFNGIITKDEEMLLRQFVTASNENLLLFRQWEKEWSGSHVMGLEEEKAYGAFKRWVSTSDKRYLFKHVVWKKIAASAAVFLLMAGSAFAAWQLAHATPESYYTCTVPYGSKTRMELPDGSIVWLNAGSTLRYSNRFSENNRKVELNGEGTFDVKKQDGKEFEVATEACRVVVKGTRFDVSAYQEDAATSVSLMRGSVEVSRNHHKVMMKPGEKVTVDTRSGKISKSAFDKDASTWVDGNLDFESISLDELTKILSRQFNVRFVIHSDRLAHAEFSVILRQKETIDDVMAALKKVQPMTVGRQGRTIHISE